LAFKFVSLPNSRCYVQFDLDFEPLQSTASRIQPALD
jgi:hypothetical protein